MLRTLIVELEESGIEVFFAQVRAGAASYTHLRAHETVLDLVCRLLLEKKRILAGRTYQTASFRFSFYGRP